MPTYTYRCSECDHQFDIFQHFYEDTLTECPVCGKIALHKVYSPVGIVFKGSGFYATDHRSPSGMPSHSNDSDSSSSSSSESTAEKSTASESASASDTKSAESSAPQDQKPSSGTRKSGKKGSSKE